MAVTCIGNSEPVPYLKFLKSAPQSGNEILSDLNNKSGRQPEKISDFVIPSENRVGRRVPDECQGPKGSRVLSESHFPRNDGWVTIPLNRKI